MKLSIEAEPHWQTLYTGGASFDSRSQTQLGCP